MSATQVANMLCDIYGSKGKMRADNLAQCFNEDVALFPLFSAPTSEALVRGRTAVVSALGVLPSAPAEADRRVFIEIDLDQGPPHSPTLSLDFYVKGSCPGVDTLLPAHRAATTEEAQDYVMVLYRVNRDRISEVAAKFLQK